MTDVASPPAASAARRQPNRRGTGDRLREELLSAALAMVESQGARQVSLRGIARRVGVAATSVYLHFPDVDHLLAAVVVQGFDQLTAATTAAAREMADPTEELRVRCRAYCHFALDHPRLYQLMFQADLPLPLREEPDKTPGRRSFDNLLAAVRRCLEAGLAPPHDDPFRLASLIWTAEHGLVLARMARPTFPWAPLDALVDEMVTRLMGFGRRGGPSWTRH
jgi:AcrR family transcriptional regulator